MLVLSRKVGERIVLTLPGGSEIWLSLLAIDRSRGYVRLGLEAPADVVISREELLLRRPGETVSSG